MNKQRLEAFLDFFSVQTFHYFNNCLHDQMLKFAQLETEEDNFCDDLQVTDEFFDLPEGFSDKLRYNRDDIWEDLIGEDFEDYTGEVAQKVIKALIEAAG